MGYFGPHSKLNTANFSINVPWGPRATKCALQEITGDGAKSHVLTVGSTVGGGSSFFLVSCLPGLSGPFLSLSSWACCSSAF